MILSKRSEQFVEKIENGTLNERYQTAECPSLLEYQTAECPSLLEGNLDNSVRQFDRYIVSCGHRLQKHRIGESLVPYCG